MQRMSDFDRLFQLIREECSAATWSKAVELTRLAEFIVDRADGEVLQLRILTPGKPVCPQVNLWLADAAWDCSVEETEDPGPLVAAAAIAYKNKISLRRPSEGGKMSATRVTYSFSRRGGSLSFERFLVSGDRKERLKTTLREAAGGIGAGRLNLPPLAATADDYAIDSLLSDAQDTVLAPAALLALFTVLSRSSAEVDLDGTRVSVSADPPQEKVVVSDDGAGWRATLVRSEFQGEPFVNGAVFGEGMLRSLFVSRLSQDEQQLLSGAGAYFALEQAAYLFETLLPTLRGKLEVVIETTKRVEIIMTGPRIVIETTAAEEELAVRPRLVYGDPPAAEVCAGRLELFSRKRVPLRDLAAEHRLLTRLRTELHLQEGRLVRFSGEEAVRIGRALEDWDATGAAVQQFKLQGRLAPKIRLRDNRLECEFQTTAGEPGHADPARVFHAWQAGENLVPLLEGGWAEIPVEWLRRYHERIAEIIEASTLEKTREVPRCLLPAAIRLCDEAGEGDYPDAVRLFRDHLERVERIPRAALPADLTASLRSYQQTGVNWLSMLRDAGLGALLADDMGLGKTLQALCVLRPKTLIVCPTSVLFEWKEQLQRFRPQLSFSLYYGPSRTLDLDADVILTSYGHLRLDQDVLAAVSWQTVILDESQTIKNPQSLVTQAAYRLSGAFRLALTGTPLENRLDELWSQFHFLNPGLLGTWREFQKRFSNRSPEALAELAARVRPFILRRTKQEAAPELPPRTESLLRCELTDDERETYQALWLAAKKTVQEELEHGSSLMHVLEALLRLRQSCCHPALLPGKSAATSAKLEVLLDSLDSLAAEGRRALVFSQWTSLLDLLEPHLREHSLSFTRLDGSTPNRGAVVAEFQDPTGPSVMLLSLKAGGTGLTLTAADHVFLMDSWWNPAVEQQAADRAHRIGQENPVFIYRLIAMDTIEERILELQEEKRRLADSILSGTRGTEGLTREDLLKLLG